LRQALLDTALRLDALGLNQGQTGNVSARRDPTGMLITPTGIAAQQLTATDLVSMDTAGAQDRGQRRPSSEWQLHARIYQARPDLMALVHTHSPYATALACLGRSIPAFHYMVVLAGGNQIPCAPYATFGSVALADHCLGALGTELRACLMANHGVLAGGESLQAAADLAVNVEHLAKIYCLSLQIGDPIMLTEAQMQQVHERMGDYGQRDLNV